MSSWDEFIDKIHEIAERPLKDVQAFNHIPVIQYFTRHLPQMFLQAGALYTQKQDKDAFVLYLRYCKMAMQLKSHKDYNNPLYSKYCTELSKNVRFGVDRCELLHKDLKIKFEEKQARDKAEAARKQEQLKQAALNPPQPPLPKTPKPGNKADGPNLVATNSLAAQPTDQIPKRDQDAPMPSAVQAEVLGLYDEDDAIHGVPDNGYPSSAQYARSTGPVGRPPSPVLISRPRVDSAELELPLPVRSTIAQPSVTQSTPVPPVVSTRIIDSVPLRGQPVTPSFAIDALPSAPVLEHDTFAMSLGEGSLRGLNISAELVDEFIRIAEPNTRNNRETCGLLMGKMSESGQHWQVTSLFIPPQKGTSDNCETFDEMKVFNAQIALEVVTLGWIHTHPSQTNFLSSVDLHTQYLHQLMLPEAVAIVVAPTDVHKKVCVYTIPVPEAMDYLSQCRMSGFHHHETVMPLFVNAAHASLKYNTHTPFDILDLR
eukprot:c20751_g1_i2.p1 GENE.c20751_g1_i2~~c20751_g1_i2.p1  ORF type:complete len:493 (+),score=112.94 c20751_g1_i2:25-1479(+)